MPADWLRAFLDSGRAKNPGPYEAARPVYRLNAEQVVPFVVREFGGVEREITDAITRFVEQHGGEAQTRTSDSSDEVRAGKRLPPARTRITWLVPADAMA